MFCAQNMKLPPKTYIWKQKILVLHNSNEIEFCDKFSLELTSERTVSTVCFFIQPQKSWIRVDSVWADEENKRCCINATRKLAHAFEFCFFFLWQQSVQSVISEEFDIRSSVSRFVWVTPLLKLSNDTMSRHKADSRRFPEIRLVYFALR